MFVTAEQLTTLATAPTTDDGVSEGWEIDRVESDWIAVKLNPYGGLALVYERFVTVMGEVKRYNDDTAEYVDATFEPLVDSYTTHVGGGRGDRVRTFNY